ncbi:hypothetical protein GGI24_002319 [Coemansia furcata]|nr:hypothetical protein GGI24_002319 [Coemansia furcata]
MPSLNVYPQVFAYHQRFRAAAAAAAAAADGNSAEPEAPSFENIMWPTTTALPMEPVASAATPSKRPYAEEQKSPRAKKVRRMAFKARRGKPFHGPSNNWGSNRRSTRIDSWGLVDYETNPSYYEEHKQCNTRHVTTSQATDSKSWGDALPVTTDMMDKDEEDSFVAEVVAELIKYL